MKNIHILSTNKPGRLHFTEFEEELVFTPKYEKLNGVNIYITNDEEIKKGDYFINKHGEISKCVKSFLELWLQTKGKEDAKKIILTTDQDLIKDGVQAIDDEFLQWFVKNPSCEEVFLTNDFKQVNQDNPILRGSTNVVHKYKIIIPKEEPKKVLTEEDIFNQKDIDAVTDYINKEQQKQHLIDMMKEDEELGLYDDIKANRIELICKDCSDSLEDCTCIVSTIDFPRQEIKLEEVFNDEKKENIKKFIDEINNPSEPNQALMDAAERLKGKELFKESNDRARKILSEIKSLPIQERPEKYSERFDNKDNEIVQGIFNSDNWGKRLVKEPKQETLEEAFEKYSKYLEDYENKNTYEHGFKDGAKCQQERMYSEEDMAESFMACWKANVPEGFECKLSFKEWFEQFKKK